VKAKTCNGSGLLTCAWQFGWSVKSSELTGNRNTKYPLGEKIGMIGHYTWYFGAAALIGAKAYASSPNGAPLLAVAQVMPVRLAALCACRPPPQHMCDAALPVSNRVHAHATHELASRKHA
jgi:hypothetical protein